MVKLMNKKTIKAIKDGIITRWYPASQAHDGCMPGDAPDCQLCEVYTPASPGHFTLNCGQCPIKELTGRNQCGGTPYYDWRKAESMGLYRTAKYNAKQMVELLMKLLPEGETVITKDGWELYLK